MWYGKEHQHKNKEWNNELFPTLKESRDKLNIYLRHATSS